MGYFLEAANWFFIAFPNSEKYYQEPLKSFFKIEGKKSRSLTDNQVVLPQKPRL